MHTEYISQEWRDNYRYALDRAREDRDRYLRWIQDEITTAITLIGMYDKRYTLGYLAARHLKASQTMEKMFLANYDGPDKEQIDEDEFLQEDPYIETVLEYAMSIATAEANNATTQPSDDQLKEIYDQLVKIKININFYEMSAEVPKDGDISDNWLRFAITTDSMNVRGDGYELHVLEVYSEMFQPFAGFLQTAYGFDHTDLSAVIRKLDQLVASKIGNAEGSAHSHKRMQEWMSKNGGDEKIFGLWRETGKHFITQFTEANPDLYNADDPGTVLLHSLNSISSYPTIFWVIPENNTQQKLFKALSVSFGDNGCFYNPPKFKAFPLNDSIVPLQPLIHQDGRYYHFSHTLPFRHLFKITEDLIRRKDMVFYENFFRGNSFADSRDNYIEKKTKQTIEKMLPHAHVYRSLEYSVEENNNVTRFELDLLAITEKAVYIIEVKAGELNAKHRRGAIKGLKDKLDETINKGSYQCERALQFIQTTNTPIFYYSDAGSSQQLVIDKNILKQYFKITVTLEQLSSLTAHLKQLVTGGVLNPSYQGAWIISLYDLMVMAELIGPEDDLMEYINYRVGLYERENIVFEDETEVLGYYFEGNFPITTIKDDEHITITGFNDEIDEYYIKKGLGMPGAVKPAKKKKT